MSWDKLSMADRANYIKLAVQNGVSNLSHIKAVYNQYAEGSDSSAGDFNTTLKQEARVNKFGKGDYKNNITVPDEGSDVYFITHEGVKHRFNTQQEAQQFVDANINSSDKRYHVATPEELKRYTTSGIRRTAGIDPDSEGAIALADRNVALSIAQDHANLFNLTASNPSEYLKQAFPNGVPTKSLTVNTDPIRNQIFKGNYNGKKFEPTESNIKHYLDLYESDKRLNKEYSAREWAKGAAANMGIGAAMAVAPYAAPYLKSAGQWAVRNLVIPEIAAQTVDLAQRAVTGTTLSEQVHDYLRYNKGLGELPSSLVGGLVNPGYWVNPLMTGKYTGPLFQKLGWTPSTSQSMYDNMISGTVLPSISPTTDAGIKATMLKLQDNVIEPIKQPFSPFNVGYNLYRSILDKHPIYRWHSLKETKKLLDSGLISLEGALRVPETKIVIKDNAGYFGNKIALPKGYKIKKDHGFTIRHEIGHVVQSDEDIYNFVRSKYFSPDYKYGSVDPLTEWKEQHADFIGSLGGQISQAQAIGGEKSVSGFVRRVAENPHLFSGKTYFHLDFGDSSGINTGAYIKNNQLFPGKAKIINQKDYIWLNKDKPYSWGINGKPFTRLIAIDEENIPNLLHVRSQSYPIGQWSGKKGFVLDSEYVTEGPIPLSKAVVLKNN